LSGLKKKQATVDEADENNNKALAETEENLLEVNTAVDDLTHDCLWTPLDKKAEIPVTLYAGQDAGILRRLNEIVSERNSHSNLANSQPRKSVIVLTFCIGLRLWCLV
jgi:hypothetical protein